jgi:uncharacterized protein
MSLLTVLAVVAVGIAVGVVSGLVGLGGGVLIVPFLYFFYDQPALFGVHVAPEARIILAHGTSLFVIVPISVRAALAYHKVGLVEWRVVWPIGLVSILAAALAARIALNVRPELLQLMFGAFLVFSGVQLLRRRRRAQRPERRRRMRLTLRHTVLVGAAVGLFSALLGVGGGVVGIPLLMYFVGIDLRRVAATSMGIIVITATAGAASYMVTGAGAQGLPPGSVGYVDVVTGLAMAAGALASVRLGTSLNQTLSPRALARVFGVLFLLLGARLILNSSGMLIGWMEAI